ncbi:hypothetical protein [Hamadaea tsunoensis]|uniref:hypothetical protein n=1 Tax=Hamadaea tsunoensis TaxID=53368 RepID=UPI000411ACF8|nr:hypothetical protein [Hamadaea tsunoensis]
MCTQRTVSAPFLIVLLIDASVSMRPSEELRTAHAQSWADALLHVQDALSEGADPGAHPWRLGGGVSAIIGLAAPNVVHLWDAPGTGKTLHFYMLVRAATAARREEAIAGCSWPVDASREDARSYASDPQFGAYLLCGTRELATSGSLARYFVNAGRDDRRRLLIELYAFLSPVVYAAVTRSAEARYGSHAHSAPVMTPLRPDRLDWFQDDLAATLADLHGCRRWQRWALPHPRIPHWLARAMWADPELLEPALQMLAWAGVKAIAGADGYGGYVERPLGRKQFLDVAFREGLRVRSRHRRCLRRVVKEDNANGRRTRPSWGRRHGIAECRNGSWVPYGRRVRPGSAQAGRLPVGR